MVHTDRGDFEVFMKGQGEPICIAHHYSEFNETGDYFAETFTGTHQVYLVNLREAGNSAKAIEPFQLSMLETIFDLEAIREEFGFQKWGFAGHSTGGMLGVIYGIYFSEKLTYTIIVGAAAREYMTFSPECIYNKKHPQFMIMQEFNETLKSPELPPLERKRMAAERIKLSLHKPERYDELFSLNINKRISAPRMNFFSRELQIFDVTRKLSLISTPTLILCGRHDVQCPVEYSIEMNELIPGSTLKIFDDSNHYPFLEERGLFNKVMDEFLQEKIHKIAQH
ncbi:alpha/beta hydrolase [Falsibacillus albus]|uniref:Alpha/beta hydrolase n=2 Tax=Falsibacillus albus TaxID=2478915 RepID=A0A3L7JRU4_9BACI|nr:alpha/beta hydrolase [Falsibacillus albus]